jgi:Cu2+-exporting ATPase
MKKTVLILGTALLLLAGGITFTACSSRGNKTKTETKAEVKNQDKKETAEYQCPMKCEGDKTYDKPGNCPVCGMHLKKIAMADGHDHERDTH